MAAPSKRLFFALWPPAEVAASLAAAAQRAQARCGGRVVQREKLHLTLAFLGEVPDAKIAAVRGCAAAVRAQAFSLVFDRIVLRRRQAMVWAACSVTPPGLAASVVALQGRLRAIGIALEERAFGAHVTLLRKLHQFDAAPLAAEETIAWPVTDFVLAESHLAAAGSSYELIDRWPLQPAPPSAAA